MGLLNTPRKYKVNLIRTLTFRCFRICSSPSLLRSGLNELRKLLLQNGYPAGIINYNINDVLNKQQNRTKNPTTTVPKKDIILVPPYLGSQSNIFAKHQLMTCINRFYGCINLRVVFQSAHRIKSFFPYKDRINRSQMSKVVYIRLVVGTARIFTLEKQNVDCMTEKLNILKRSRVTVVSFAAVIRVVTQRFSLVGEKRCVTTLITAAEETRVTVMRLLSQTTSRQLVKT